MTLDWHGGDVDKSAKTTDGRVLRVRHSRFRPPGRPWVASINGINVYDEDGRGRSIDHFDTMADAVRFLEQKAGVARGPTAV